MPSGCSAVVRLCDLDPLLRQLVDMFRFLYAPRAEAAPASPLIAPKPAHVAEGAAARATFKDCLILLAGLTPWDTCVNNRLGVLFGDDL